MRKGRRHSHVRAQIEEWESELIRKVASAFDTPEREELEAELSRKMVELKAKDLSHVRDWKGYLAKFLYNKASNWVRDARAREKRTGADPELLDAVPHQGGTPSLDQAAELRLAFDQAWRDLDPRLRLVWAMLLEEDGNQMRVAERLNKHRNTIRLWIREIKEALRKHGI